MDTNKTDELLKNAHLLGRIYADRIAGKGTSAFMLDRESEFEWRVLEALAAEVCKWLPGDVVIAPESTHPDGRTVPCVRAKSNGKFLIGRQEADGALDVFIAINVPGITRAIVPLLERLSEALTMIGDEAELGASRARDVLDAINNPNQVT
jgi:hypothetical protein